MAMKNRIVGEFVVIVSLDTDIDWDNEEQRKTADEVWEDASVDLDMACRRIADNLSPKYGTVFIDLDTGGL